MIARSESPIVDAISHEPRRPLYERGDIIRCLRAWLQSIEPAEADRFLAGLRLRGAGAGPRWTSRRPSRDASREGGAMSRYRQYVCVVKARGRAAVVVSLREGYEYESLGETISTRPLDGFCTLRIAYDVAASDELEGPLVVTGVGTEGQPRSLDLGEAERIAAQFSTRRARASADENVIDDVVDDEDGAR